MYPSRPLSKYDYKGDNKRTDYELSSFLSSNIEYSLGSDINANYDLTNGEPTDSSYDTNYGRTNDNSTDSIINDDYRPTSDTLYLRRGFF